MNSALMKFSRPSPKSQDQQDVHLFLMDPCCAKRVFTMWQHARINADGLQFSAKFKEVELEMFTEKKQILEILAFANEDSDNSELAEIVTHTLNYWNCHQNLKKVDKPEYEVEKHQLLNFVEQMHKIIPDRKGMCTCKRWEPIIEMTLLLVARAQEREEEIPSLIEVSEDGGNKE